MLLTIPDAALDGNSFFVDSRAIAEQLVIPVNVQSVVTGGYYTNADNGGGYYVRVVSEPLIDEKFQDASGAWFELVEVAYNVKSFGAKGDGVTDDANAFYNTWLKALGKIIVVPQGNFIVADSLPLQVNGAGVFSPGVKLIGQGTGVSNITFLGNNSALFKLSSATASKFAMGVEFSGLKLIGGGGTNADAIDLSSCFMANFKQLWVTNFTGDGINFDTTLGDPDANNMVNLDQVRIENCAGWGLQVGGVSGTNENSFTRLQHVFIQNCGTIDAAYIPPSGGFMWKGQILQQEGGAYTLNKNVGFYIPAGAGQPNSCGMDGVSFENNFGKHVFVRSIHGFKFVNGSLFAKEDSALTHGFHFEAAAGVIKSVNIDGAIIRATQANACTMFLLEGANADKQSCRVTNTVWENYDYAGQSRFNGFYFDPVNKSGEIIVASTTSLLYRTNNIATLGQGSSVPVRLAGPNNQTGVGVRSTTGEIIAYQIPGGVMSLANTGIGNNITGYVYIRATAATQVTAAELVFSTDAPVFDGGASASGYLVSSGNPTYIYLGRAKTDAGGLFVTSGQGWLNPLMVPGSTGRRYMWFDATNILRGNSSQPANDTDGTAI